MSIREVFKTCISTVAIGLCIALPVTQAIGQKSISESGIPAGMETSDNVRSTVQSNMSSERRPCPSNPSPGGACPHTIGYWKNQQTHLFDILEIGPINLGDRVINTVAQARDVLSQTSTSDARVMLRAQLLAAMLNRANGSSPIAAGFDVDVQIAQGQSFLASHPSPVLTGHPDREQALFIRDKNDQFNNAHCEDPECDDFVTGGGWIRLPTGEKANFGVHGGIKNGDLWGGLNYIDHRTGMHVKSTSTTGYVVLTENRRRISYNVTIDGVPGTAVVEVEDNGEPGRDDWFQIQLSNGYFASGDLGGAGPGGGNIQLHRRGNNCNPPHPPPPSNCGSVTIIKEVQTPNGGTSSTTAFSFTASPKFGRTSFDLVDDNNGPGVDRQTSITIKKFGAANAITVTEAALNGWTLADIICVETVNNTTVNIGTRTATIVVDPGENVVCTFRNTQLVPSAASASVSGRVVDAYGNGISGASLVMSDVQQGTTWVVRTNPFGYYTIEGPEVGNFYMIVVNHKRFSFEDGTRTFGLSDNITGMDFVASP
jgi:hypothetical protein